jgi:membrane protein DedA with SNARE-associated domain
MAFLIFYVGIGALLTLEEAGLFLLPGDISLVAGGMHAAQGGSVIFITWLVSAAGMVAGASILYHGVSRSGASRRLLPRRVVRLVRRHGVWGVAVARLVPGLRNATVFAAASARMPYRHFVYGLVPAALVWSGLLLLLGWFGGSAMLSTFGAMHHSHMLQFISLGLLMVAVLFILWRLRPRESKAVAEARSRLAG